MENQKLFDAEKYNKQTLRAANALFDTPTAGVKQNIDTLTQIINDVVYAKYYTTPSPLTDYVKIDVGRGAYAGQIFQYVAGFEGASFKECLINPASTGVHNNAVADIRVDGITIKNNFFRQKYSISQEELKMAAAGMVPFDVIEAKEKSRVTNWQLGFQETLFLGLGDGVTNGLLNQTGVTVNTSLLPVAPGSLTVAQTKAFAANAIATYYAQTNGTYFPNRWLMPSASYMQLGVPYGDTFGMPTLREVLENAFKAAGAPDDFKIVHSIYGTGAGASGKHRHVLYNNDVDNIVMYNPKPYTPHPLYPVGSLDMISDAEAQFSGVQVKKPTTVLYIDEQA